MALQLTIEQSTVCVLGNNSNLIPSIHWHFKGQHQTRYKTVLKQIFILGQNLPFHFCEFLNSIQRLRNPDQLTRMDALTYSFRILDQLCGIFN